MLILQNISYTHPNKDLLFSNIDFALNKKDKTALIGNNGTGKSTLLKIITGELIPSSGQVKTDVAPYYLPQIFGQFDYLTIAEALKIDHKISALKEILNGSALEKHFNTLAEDWSIEERCQEAFSYWHLKEINLDQKLETLSGGQKTKIFLAGIMIHQSNFILLDEPSNHLDIVARSLLYDFIKTTSATMLTVSHDRKLLNILDKVCELDKNGITIHGGNYEFYSQQKEIGLNALKQDLKSKEKVCKGKRTRIYRKAK